MRLLQNQRLKHLLLLMATQIGCIAVGLWLHYHFTVAELYRAAERQATAEIGENTDELLQAISHLDLSDDLNGSAELAEMDKLFQARRLLPDMRLTLTDSQWRVLATLPAPDTASVAQESPGQTLAWTTPPNHGPDMAGRVMGALATPEGRQVAFGIRLNGRDGYAVIHYPLERAELAPATITSLLSVIGLMTWLWTSTLLLIPVYLITTRFHDERTSSRTRSETTALRNIQSLVRTRDAVIFGLAKLAESRDDMTGQHLERISAYASRLAASVRHHPKYCHAITAEFMELIGISSALHDIGKVGIEDAILLKPGRLTPSERARIEEHAAIGGRCLSEIERHLGRSNFLEMAREIAWSHHERWDGTGYPNGLAGEQIPLAARIVSVADVYDALATRRTYKQAMPHKDCVAIIQEGWGTQFDPDLVEAFSKIEDSFHQISRQYGECLPEKVDSAPEESVSKADWQNEALSTLEAVLQESRTGSTNSPEFD